MGANCTAVVAEFANEPMTKAVDTAASIRSVIHTHSNTKLPRKPMVQYDTSSVTSAVRIVSTSSTTVLASM